MQIEHRLPEQLLRKPVKILLVGAGGTGSAVLLQLPYLHQAMRVWGHPYGLEVTVMDGDVVSETNCVRQPFSRGDVGLNKSEVLVSRLNLFWGLNWKAIPEFFSRTSIKQHFDASYDIVIGCVDSRAARAEIEAFITSRSSGVHYWLDLGNGASTGQFVLGQPQNWQNRRSRTRLRTVSELFPEITDTSAGEDSLPSCSAAEAIERQEPFINQTLASAALAMLSRLFHHGGISHHGAFFSAESGRMAALPVDPDRWGKAATRNRNQRKKAARKAA